MSTSKKGYLFVILLLGVAVTGVGIISAHSLDQYAGIGSVGIHGVKDTMSIHIPGDIYFNSQNGIFQRYLTLDHDITAKRTQHFPDTNGTIVVISDLSNQPSCSSLTQGVIWKDPNPPKKIWICINGSWESL